MKRKPVPSFIDDTCQRLTLAEVPPLEAGSCCEMSYNGDAVCAARVEGVLRRWRFRAGRLLSYVVFKVRPDKPAQNVATGIPTGRMIPDPNPTLYECPWSAVYQAEDMAL